MNYIYFFSFLFALAFIDFNIIRYLLLKWQEFCLNIERFLFRLRLEKDLLLIRFNKRRYVEMAKQILKDLDTKND
jgi:hypothetical protein